MDTPRARGVEETSAERTVGQEVRCRDAHLAARAFDEQLKCHARHGRAIGRRALHDERRRLALSRQLRELSGPGQDLAAALEPVLGEHTLKGADDWPLHARHGVAPGARAVRRRPPVGNARTADKRHASIDDEELAVRPVVQPMQPVPRHALIALNGAAGVQQPRETGTSQPGAADGVHDNEHADSGPRALRQRVDELVADAAWLEDVALDIHRYLGGANGGQHRRVERHAVGQDVHAVALVNRGLTG